MRFGIRGCTSTSLKHPTQPSVQTGSQKTFEEFMRNSWFNKGRPHLNSHLLIFFYCGKKCQLKIFWSLYLLLGKYLSFFVFYGRDVTSVFLLNCLHCSFLILTFSVFEKRKQMVGSSNAHSHSSLTYILWSAANYFSWSKGGCRKRKQNPRVLVPIEIEMTGLFDKNIIILNDTNTNRTRNSIYSWGHVSVTTWGFLCQRSSKIQRLKGCHNRQEGKIITSWWSLTNWSHHFRSQRGGGCTLAGGERGEAKANQWNTEGLSALLASSQRNPPVGSSKPN